MRKAHYKLVRDKIPEIIAKDGKIPKYTVITDPGKFERLLSIKLDEEVGELSVLMDSLKVDYFETKVAGEIADIYEVLFTIMDLYNIPPDLVQAYIDAKRNEKGGFSNRIFLEEVIDNEVHSEE